MPAGERKMPEPMVLPTRIATALQSPMRRGSDADSADDIEDVDIAEVDVDAAPEGAAGASDAGGCDAGSELGIHYATARGERWRVV